MKNTDCFLLREEVIMSTLLLSLKINGTQRRSLVSLWITHCKNCGKTKGTSQAEVMPAVKNQAHYFNHCWVALVWRHHSGRQAGRQVVSQSVENSFFKIKSQLFESGLGQSEHLFGLNVLLLWFYSFFILSILL